MTLNLATAAINAPRDSHYALNPVTGLFERTLLLEGARTNGVTNSGNAMLWPDLNLVTRANDLTGPDGVANSATTITETTDVSPQAHVVTTNAVACTAGAAQSAAVFLKPLGRTRLMLQLSTAKFGANRSMATVDLSGAGAVAQLSAIGTASNPTQVRIAALSNGWFRVAVTGIPSTGDTTVCLTVRSCDDTANATYTGDGRAAFGVFGGQIEADQPFSSSYISTTAAAVTRSADSLSFPFTLTPQAMTVYAKYIDLGTSQKGGARILEISDVADVTRRFLLNTPGTLGAIQVFHDNGTASVAEGVVAGIAVGDLIEARGVLNADGSVLLGVARNGGVESVSATSAANALAGSWSGPLLWIGGVNGSSNTGFAAFQAVKVMRGIMTMDQMRGF